MVKYSFNTSDSLHWMPLVFWRVESNATKQTKTSLWKQIYMKLLLSQYILIMKQ